MMKHIVVVLDEVVVLTGCRPAVTVINILLQEDEMWI